MNNVDYSKDKWKSKLSTALTILGAASIGIAGIWFGYNLIKIALTENSDILNKLRQQACYLPFLPGILFALIGVVPYIFLIKGKTEKKKDAYLEKSEYGESDSTTKKPKSLNLFAIIMIVAFLLGIILGIIYIWGN